MYKRYLKRMAASSIIIGTFAFYPTVYFNSTIPVAYAEVKHYTGVGKYIISDFEDYEIAKQRAKYRAEQDAKDKAGVYLRNYSSTSNARLTEDDILTITNNIVSEISIDYQKKPFEAYDNNGKTTGEVGYICEATIKVNIDTDGIANYLQFDDKTKETLITQAKKVQKSAVENDKKVESLRERIKNAKTDSERAQIKAEYKQVDIEFLANQLFEEGNKLYYAKNYQGAIQKYKDVIKLNPKDDMAYGNQALAYSELQNYNEALVNFNKAIELNPNNNYAYNNRGTIYNKLKNYQQAIADYNKAIELNSKYTEAYNNRGNAYSMLNDMQHALSDYNKAIELNPQNVQSYYNRGNLYARLGKNYKLAIDDYTKAIELNPKDFNYYMNRAITYININNFDLAIIDLNKVIELNPTYAWAYSNRGMCYLSLVEMEEAVENYNKAIELDPNNNLNYYFRGVAYKVLGETAKAEADFAKAKQLGG